jgi:hypothetical protein
MARRHDFTARSRGLDLAQPNVLREQVREPLIHETVWLELERWFKVLRAFAQIAQILWLEERSTYRISGSNYCKLILAGEESRSVEETKREEVKEGDPQPHCKGFAGDQIDSQLGQFPLVGLVASAHSRAWRFALEDLGPENIISGFLEKDQAGK